jgi:formiminoglutamase
MKDPVVVKRGSGPIILGFPHVGTYVPDDVMGRLNEVGQALTDTDWYVDKLYEGILDDVTIIKAQFSRYVIDANRDPKGISLYPGQNTTTLCPTTDFEGTAIYYPGDEPTPAEIEERRTHFHAPYHQAIADEINRLKTTRSDIVLFDCHSIRSQLPFLFEGTLPDLNLGTNEGQTCASEIERRAFEICNASPFSTVLNGRFKGGWTTRHYADPANGVHTFQMETAQSAYLEDEQAPWTFSDDKAAKLRPVLKSLLTMMQDYCAANEARS